MKRTPRSALIALGMASASLASAQWSVLHFNGAGLSGSGFTDIGASGPVGISRGHIPSDSRATVWGTTPNSWIDLSAGQQGVQSGLLATDGSTHGGYYNGGSETRAAIWNAVTHEMTLLNTPQGFAGANVYGISGTQHVGSVYTISQGRAALWTGSGTDPILLEPDISSLARDTNGTVQVGGVLGSATLWHGTHESAVDLTPSFGQYGSYCTTIGGSVIGGYSSPTSQTAYQATIWDLNTLSAQSIHDPAYTGTRVHDTDGIIHVGVGHFEWASPYRALAWIPDQGVVDLHNLLPAEFTTSSAEAVYQSNGTITIVGSAQTSVTGAAVMWRYTPVPEPGTLAALALGIGVLARRRRSRAHRKVEGN